MYIAHYITVLLVFIILFLTALLFDIFFHATQSEGLLSVPSSCGALAYSADLSISTTASAAIPSSLPQ